MTEWLNKAKHTLKLKPIKLKNLNNPSFLHSLLSWCSSSPFSVISSLCESVSIHCQSCLHCCDKTWYLSCGGYIFVLENVPINKSRNLKVHLTFWERMGKNLNVRHIYQFKFPWQLLEISKASTKISEPFNFLWG